MPLLDDITAKRKHGYFRGGNDAHHVGHHSQCMFQLVVPLAMRRQWTTFITVLIGIQCTEGHKPVLHEMIPTLSTRHKYHTFVINIGLPQTVNSFPDWHLRNSHNMLFGGKFSSCKPKVACTLWFLPAKTTWVAKTGRNSQQKPMKSNSLALAGFSGKCQECRCASDLCVFAGGSGAFCGRETACRRPSTGTACPRCAPYSADARCSGRQRCSRTRRKCTGARPCEVECDAADCTGLKISGRRSCSRTADHHCDCSCACAGVRHGWTTCCNHKKQF